MTRLEELQRALKIIAFGVVRHGDAYAPLLDLIEEAIEAERHRVNPRDRAAKILAELTREVRNVPAAG